MQEGQRHPEVIPLLLLRGRTILFKEYSKRELSDFSKELRRKNFEKLYIMDLDGLERNKPQLDVVQRLSDDFMILYEGGPRKGANIIDFIMAGAEIAYMNTASIESFGEIEIALSYSENIGLKVDWSNGIIGEGLPEKSLENIMRKSVELGIKDFVLPVEVLPMLRNDRFKENVIIRAIADRPGDESNRNIEANSIIIDHKLIAEERKT